MIVKSNTLPVSEATLAALVDLQGDEGWLPTGQAILKHGFRKMSYGEAYAKMGLSCKDACRYCIARPGYHATRNRCGKVPKMETLKTYRQEAIPQSAMNRIRIARSIGLADMYVLWVEPFKAKKHQREPDPVVLAHWEEECWFIVDWDVPNEDGT